MATVVVTTRVDDLDGSTGDVETLRFALDGAEFEIDLKEENAARLRTALRCFTDVARPAGTPSRTINPNPPAKTIRAWARGAGFRVADRGALAAGVRVAFAARAPGAVHGL